MEREAERDTGLQLEKSVRRLREKFHGKIAIDKATLLMRRYGNNHRIVAMEIILMKDRDLDDEDRLFLKNDHAAKNVVRKLQAEELEQASHPPRAPPAKEATRECEEEPSESRDCGQTQPQPQSKTNKEAGKDKIIQELGERLRVLPLTEKNLQMFDNAQRNLIPSALHQFACQTCDHDWWRRVPQRKRVSRCRRCKVKYDPLPADKMWGIGEFHCPNCTHTFRGFGWMDLGSPCYICRSVIQPTQILPPRRDIKVLTLRRKNPHSCLAEDCYNRQEPHVPGTECVHPRSRQAKRQPRVLNASPVHVSTGSTVNTCLSQGSILDVNDLILDSICEESEDEVEDDAGSGQSDGSTSGHSRN